MTIVKGLSVNLKSYLKNTKQTILQENSLLALSQTLKQYLSLILKVKKSGKGWTEMIQKIWL